MCPECDKTWTRGNIATGRERYEMQRGALASLGMAALLGGESKYATPALTILQRMPGAYAG